MIIFILAPSCVFTQNSVLGKIYGKKGVAKYIKVLNITQRSTTFSNEEGNFEIKATENDSISFSSSFYETKKIIVNKTHLNEIYVFHLKEKINELDEVVVKSEPQFKEFNTEEFNLELQTQIREDIKNNPQQYRPASDGSLNFLAVIDLIAKLFNTKSKKNISKSKRELPKNISYEDFDVFFKENSFFKETIFKQHPQISDDDKYLFFAFCEAKEISAENLKKENHFLLLDILFRAKNDFMLIIEDNKNKP